MKTITKRNTLDERERERERERESTMTDDIRNFIRMFVFESIDALFVFSFI